MQCSQFTAGLAKPMSLGLMLSTAEIYTGCLSDSSLRTLWMGWSCRGRGQLTCKHGRGCEVHLQGIQPQEALRAAARQAAEIKTKCWATTQGSTSNAAWGTVAQQISGEGRVCEDRGRLFSPTPDPNLMKPQRGRSVAPGPVLRTPELAAETSPAVGAGIERLCRAPLQIKRILEVR